MSRGATKSGSPPDVAAELIAARLVQYAATTLLFGALLFPVYTTFPHARGRDRTALAPAALPFLRAASALAIISALAWFAFTVAQMAGDTAAAGDVDLLISTARDTDFGRLWTVRLAVAVALLSVLCWRRTTGLWGLLLASILLGSLALTGHAGSGSGLRGWIHVAADALHLLSAGFWIGALPALVAAVTGGSDFAHRAQMHRTLSRFSSVAVIVVGLLVATGVVNTVLMIASPRDLLRTRWGLILLTKLGLVAGMLALAAVNRRRHTPALVGPIGGEAAITTLRRNILFELVLAALIIALVSLLGLLPPTG